MLHASYMNENDLENALTLTLHEPSANHGPTSPYARAFETRDVS